MGANGAKKGWLDRMFRGDAVPADSYNEPEPAPEEPESSRDSVPDGTYARRPQTQSMPRRDNVVTFPRAQTKDFSGFSMGSGDTAGGHSRAAGSAYPRESSSTREFGGGSGGGGTGGGFGASGVAAPGEAYVIFKRLKDFPAATAVADRMTERKIVILNLESCDDDTARRVLDFLGGVAYACSSMVKRIAGRVFMITPEGVNSDGEFFDEVKTGAIGINYDD